MRNRTFVLTAAAVALGALLTASSTQAASPLTNINHLTFSGAVALPGVVLSAGTYTFEAGPNGTPRTVVRVTSRDRLRILYMGFTTPVRRMEGNRVEVAFGEAAAGQPVPIKTWYPMGSETGHQFRY